MQFRARALLCSSILVCSLVASAAHAQSQRTFVASTGLDTNPCSRTQPCRNFAAAVAATVSGGEVIVLDSAGYGPVTISQSVSLTAPSGVYAGIASPGAIGVTINAPAGTVTIRGLNINGNQTSGGVLVQAVGVLHIERTTVSNFSAGFQHLSDGLLFVDDSTFRANGNGFFVEPLSGFATASFDHCRFEQNVDNGLYIQGTAAGTTVLVRECVFANNAARAGIVAYTSEVNVKNCVFSNNSNGILSASGGVVSVGRSAIMDNVEGIVAGGIVQTFVDNVMSGNSTTVAGSLTPVAKQ